MKTIFLLLLALCLGCGPKKVLTPSEEAAISQLLLNSFQTNFTYTVVPRTNP